MKPISKLELKKLNKLNKLNVGDILVYVGSGLKYTILKRTKHSFIVKPVWRGNDEWTEIPFNGLEHYMEINDHQYKYPEHYL